MVELREPPGREAVAKTATPPWVWALVALQILVLLVVGLRSGSATRSSEGLRDVAAQLRAAGALKEAARTLEGYVVTLSGGSERAAAAYSLGDTYLELGDPEKALRWFYEAESFDDGELKEDLSRKVVHSLERLGRFQAAQSALESRVRLDEADPASAGSGDPVVARIEQREIRLSELERSIDDLPPAVANGLRGADARRDYLRKYVADALLWRKAQKLEYDRDPELQRRFEQTLQQLAISKYLEEEVLSEIDVDETDVRNFFEANRSRYQQGETPVSLDDLRSVVQRDYLQLKAQSAYQDAVDSELAAADVELFPERLEGAGNG